MAEILLDGIVRLQVPPSTVPVRSQGADSVTTAWEGNGLSILVDRGPFADRLDQSATRIVVDGIPVRFASFVDQHGAAVAVAHINGLQITIVVRADPGSNPELPTSILRTLSISGPQPLNTAPDEQGDTTR